MGINNSDHSLFFKFIRNSSVDLNKKFLKLIFHYFPLHVFEVFILRINIVPNWNFQ